MVDEETGAEPRVVNASIADPYLMLVRDDSSVFVAKIDKNMELEEIEKEHDDLLSTKWLTGCLYEDKTGIFANVQTDRGTKPGENIVMFLLSGYGALHVSRVRHLGSPMYVTDFVDLRSAGPFKAYLRRRRLAVCSAYLVCRILSKTW